jgi:hypothetical protein
VGRVVARGSAVLAVPTADERGVQLALRPGGGRFAGFTTVALPDGVTRADLERLAFNGDMIATPVELEGAWAVLLVAADGTLKTVSLPGAAVDDPEAIGTELGLDRAARGLALYGGAGGALLAARFDRTGLLGPPQVLAPRGVGGFHQVRLAVAPDGSAAAAWPTRSATTVVTGSTERGFDVSTATTAPLAASAAIEPDGGAAAFGARSGPAGDHLLITTRRPGQPFTAVRSYRADELLGPPPFAIANGRYLVVFGHSHSWSRLAGLRAVTGRLGEPPGPELTIPNASAETESAVAVLAPGAPATALTTNSRRIFCPNCRIAHERREIGVYRFSPDPPRRPPGVTVSVAPRQRLGDDRSIRVEVRCPRACAVRIVGSVVGSFDPEAEFDASRTLPAGTTSVRVVIAKTPSRAFRARMGVAVDDRTGELRTRRTLVIEP